MKKILQIIFILALCLSSMTNIQAEKWNTNASGVIIPDDSWKEMISINKVIKKGAYDPKDGSGMAHLVLYCSDSCKVTNLQTADVNLGGYMCKVTISNGKPIHGKEVKPTYKNEVFDEDFNAYLNGEGTYWKLSEGIYYMESVNRSHCIYLIVGDPLSEKEHVHQYKEVNIVEPTCTEKGYTLKECSGCKNTIKENITKELGHLWDQGKLNIKGKLVVTCTRCKVQEERKLSEILDICSHQLNYSSPEKGIITQVCELENCKHSASVKLEEGSTLFTGKDLDAKITYDENWYGEQAKVSYYNRKGPGNMDVTLSIGGVSTKITYRIVADVPLDLSKFISSERSTWKTLKNSSLFLDNIAKKDIKDVVESMTAVSLFHASDEQKQIIQQRIIDLLTKATYRPIQYGGKKANLQKFPYQNDGEYGKSGRSIKDSGLDATVKWQTKGQGCAAYARFFSAYVYGNDGTHPDIYDDKGIAGAYTTFKATSAKELRDQIRTIADPGETIQYNNGIHHKIVFLGESADSKGFYFVSYGGGKYYSNDYWEIELRYITYSGFVDLVGGKDYIVRDTNGTPKKKSNTPGSYYEGDAKQVKITNNKATIIANCPIEMIISIDDETLDSRLLNDGQTQKVSFGIMSVKGDKGKDRQITLEMNKKFYESDYDLKVLGTDTGTMNLTIIQSYFDENNKENIDTRQFINVPVSSISEAEISINNALSDVCLLNKYSSDQEYPDLWVASPCEDEEMNMSQTIDQPTDIEFALSLNNPVSIDEDKNTNSYVPIIVGCVIVGLIGLIMIKKKK